MLIYDKIKCMMIKQKVIIDEKYSKCSQHLSL